ncbi:LysE family translocator [Sporomusa termitida]|uniref:2A76: homoserine/Threonine efflux protein n=1 Tax=Sporomusa termitida TaxID=2377 RepID=A0A517E099_9FIRM|nr:LysE family translocator [Sporomusa termitida]QDR82998.1 2A76: homoserine/Threonine efflux protein [Sporomusa termitida]
MLLAKDTLAAAPAQAAMSPKDTFWQGLIIDVLNPKVALFFLSFLPQFIDPHNSYGIIPFLILGLTFIVTGALWLLGVVYFSAKVTTLLREKTNVMNKVCGSLYLLLGAKLLAAEKS